MRLTIVGSGDAFGSGGRFNTCFQLESSNATLLIDCGASSLVALNLCGIKPNNIDGVIVSHLHGDHFGGLPFLLIDAQHNSRANARNQIRRRHFGPLISDQMHYSVGRKRAGSKA